MTIKHHILKDKNILISIFEGLIGDDEFIETYHELYKSPQYKLGLNELVDFSKADFTNLSADGLNRVFDIVSHLYISNGLDKEIKTAIVAPDDLSFGLSRMYQITHDQSEEEMMVFRTMDSALKWLELNKECLFRKLALETFE